MLDQVVGGIPGLLIGLADDHMQPNAEGQRTSAPRGGGPDPGDLFSNLRRRLAPGQVFVDRIDRDIDARVR